MAHRESAADIIVAIEGQVDPQGAARALATERLNALNALNALLDAKNAGRRHAYRTHETETE